MYYIHFVFTWCLSEEVQENAIKYNSRHLKVSEGMAKSLDENQAALFSLSLNTKRKQFPGSSLNVKTDVCTIHNKLRTCYDKKLWIIKA